MFGFGVSEEQFNVYKSELFGRLDGIKNVLTTFTSLKQDEERRELEEDLEEKQTAERIEPEERDRSGPNFNGLIALLIGAMAGRFNIGQTGSSLVTISRGADGRIRILDGLQLPEPVPEFESMEGAMERLNGIALPEVNVNPIDQDVIAGQVEDTNKTILDRLSSLFGRRREQPRANARREEPRTLGNLSERFESGTRGSNAVGHDSTGGTSYGRFQIQSKRRNGRSTMDSFLEYAEEHNPEVHRRLMAAGDPDTGTQGAFAREWRRLAADPNFAQLEHNFIRRTHYDEAFGRLPNNLKQRVTSSRALQEVLWSTSVQHGAVDAARIFERAQLPGINEESLIRRIYQIRSTQFENSTDRERAGVLNRFRQEEASAVGMIGPQLAQTGESLSQLSQPQSRVNIVSADNSQTNVSNQRNVTPQPPINMPLNARNPVLSVQALGQIASQASAQ